jgi:ribose transport system substrate-binding protein
MKLAADKARGIRPHRKSPAIVLGAALAAVTLAACSSGKTASTTQNQSAGQATSSASVSAAKTAVAGYEQVPTSLGLPSLTSKAPTGKTIVFINGGTTQTNQNALGIQAAAAAAGWKYREITDDQSDASSVLAAFKQALQYHPYAVSTTGSPYSQFASVLPAYAKAGAIILPVYGAYPVSSTLPANIVGDASFTTAGKMLAAWVTADSGGTGDVLLVGTDAFPSLAELRVGFQSELAQGCPGCKVTTIQLTVAQALGNQGNPVVVNALRRNPDIKYVVGVDGAFLTGLSSSLSSAGLQGKVKIATGFGDVANETAIKAGNESVTTGNPSLLAGWLTVDAALRHLEGMPYPAGYGALPNELLTSTDTWSVGTSYNEPADYATLFEQLWKIG